MNKASVIILLTFTATVLTFSSFAQESGFPAEEERQTESQYNPEEEWSPKEGGMVLTEERNVANAEKKIDSPQVLTNQGKTTASRPAAKTTAKPANTPEKSSVTAQDKDDDSVLSYNFLYYLIQKFKFDTVE